MGSSKTIGEIRAPQLVGMFGPGSIVNLEKLSVMPRGVQDWQASSLVESPTFGRQIGARKLIDVAAMTRNGIPVDLFPRVFVCRVCNTVQKKEGISQDNLRYGFRCYRNDGGALYPSRWIRYCPKGHIEDFDYGYFVHRGIDCGKRITLETGASLSETWVHCECGAKASMRDAYGASAPGSKCFGNSPWSRPANGCGERMKISMRSASDVYFGAVRSAISIEPESDPRIADVFQKLSEATQAKLQSDSLALEYLRGFKSFEERSDAELAAAIRLFFLSLSDPVSYKDRGRQEYNALARTCGSPRDDLYVEQLDSGELEAYGFEGMFAVRKLREVRALVGFRRGGIPADPGFDETDASDGLVSIGGEGVFPAYQNRGEGIFLTFSRSLLRSWMGRDAVASRTLQFRQAEERWRQSGSRSGGSRSRGYYLLAHTYAHVLIRQLSLVSGYSQSSLRERIYVSQDDAEEPWAGILIYTSSSDADGSLGGLVAVATDGRIPQVIAEARQSLRICSSDPMCALQLPKGFRKLSGAACHSCVVLPETCCERNNNFLDRILVIPQTVNDGSAELCYSHPL